VNFLMIMHVYLVRNVRIHDPRQPRTVRDAIRFGAQFLKVGCLVCT
jgi:hypothetical protein